jgi:hypothetical protein
MNEAVVDRNGAGAHCGVRSVRRAGRLKQRREGFVADDKVATGIDYDLFTIVNSKHPRPPAQRSGDPDAKAPSRGTGSTTSWMEEALQASRVPVLVAT